MKRFFLLIIILVAFILRFTQFWNLPAGLNADEASFGYDAYSILHTGRDQWGNFMPLVLKSFGDYKSPLYAYLTVPSVAVFGLNVFATRLPNIIIGTLAVLAVYLLISEIGKFLPTGKAGKIGFVASALLAVNPWAVMMSRGAFEANLITFFLPMGVYFFLKGLKDNKFFIWSALFFGLDLFTYHSAKLITPIVILGLVVVFREKLRSLNMRKIIAPALILLVFISLTAYTFIIGGGSRISERSITQGALEEGFQERMEAISKGVNPVVAKIFHNKYQVIVSHFTSNYFQYFSPKFLIFQGAGDGSYGMIPGIGTVYFLEVVLFLGIIPLIVLEKKSKKLILILLLWLMITPLTGALATGVGYSGNRAEGMIPVLQIIEAFGFFGWVLLLKKYKVVSVKLVGVVFAGIFIFQIYGFVNSYFKTPSNLVLRQMLYGNLDASKWLSQNSGGRDILVSRSITEPQIFIAFENKWNPKDYQTYAKSWDLNTAQVVWLDQLTEYKLGSYTIKSIDWKKDFNKSNTLIVCRPDEPPAGIEPSKVINYQNGDPDIFIVDTNQKNYAKAI
jgi:4-amino-4-deoxy-L-arabinose transferase-like glycosyltransferase